MAFWAVIAQIVKAIIEIKKVIDVLSALSSRNFVEGFIRSYIVGSIMDGLVQSGVPLDKLDFLGQAEEWADHVLGEVAGNLAQHGLKIDHEEVVGELLAYRDRVLDGRAVGNGLPPSRSIGRGADPVVLTRGEFEREVSDLHLNGAGLDFQLHRTYRSGAAFVGPLGFGWDHSYNLRLYENNEFVFTRLTGRLGEERFVRHPRFSETDFAYYAPPDGVHGVLVLDDNGSLVLVRPHGVVYAYEQSSQVGEHRIAHIQDRFGNYLAFLYSGDDLLERVLVNSPDRHATFLYDDLGRITLIRDHAGREVIYSYDEEGYLASVTNPVSRGERPASREHYEYGRVGRTSKLVRVLDSSGRLLVENEYSSDDLSEDFGKVVRQCENRGETSFLYEPVREEFDPVVPGSDLPALRVLERWRNGHEVEHVFNDRGNELLTRDRFLQDCRVVEATRRYRYNGDGQIVASVDPEGAVSQFLYERDRFIDELAWPALDPVLADVPIRDRLAFGNLLAEVTRGRPIRHLPGDSEPSFWDREVSTILQRGDPDDVIIKYRYGRDHQLLISKSDPRWTVTADAGHVESAEVGAPAFDPADLLYIRHQAMLTRFEYGPGPRFELQRTRFPDRTRPSVIDGKASVTRIAEEFPSYDARGRPLERVDTRGYVWMFSYYDQAAGPREGFPRRRLVPHADFILDDRAPELIEVVRGGSWRRQPRNWLSNGNPGDHLRVTVEGVRIVLQQSVDAAELVSANSNVRVTIDGVAGGVWNQAHQPTYVINDLDRGSHILELSTARGSIAVGRIHSHVSFDYEVDDLGQVLNEWDARGTVTHHVLDTVGRRISTTSGPRGNPSVVHFSYDLAGRPTKEIKEWRDETGKRRPELAVVRRMQYDVGGNLLSESDGSLRLGQRRRRTYTYDADDNMRSTTNSRGNRTYYLYDSLNRQIGVVRAACTADQAVTMTTYDLAGRVFSRRDPRGAMQANAYRDAAGNWRRGLDTRGRVRVQTDPLGHALVTDYDRLDQPSIARKFQRRRDGTFELISRRYTEYDEHGDAVRLSEDVFDLPIATADPFDAPDLEFDVAAKAGLVRVAVTERHLDAQGNVVAIRNPDGRIQRFRRDGQGRVCEVLDPESTKTVRLFDENGNVVRVYAFEPVRTGTGGMLRHEVFVEDHVFDESNREIVRRDSYGNRWAYAYDTLGNRTRTDDPLNNVVRAQHNAFGQESMRTFERSQTGVGGDPPLPPFISQRHYDDAGNLSAIIDFAGRRRTFEYDTLDRLIESRFAANPQEPPELRSYDRADNLIRLVDRNGVVQIRLYDLANQHIRTDIDTTTVGRANALSPLSPRFVAFQYDANGGLTSHENDYCAVNIQRDSRGLAIKDAVTIRNVTGAPGPFSVDRRFDIAGNREALTYPSGRVVSYAHDGLGRVIAVRGVLAPPDYPGLGAHKGAFDVAKYYYVGGRLVEVRLGNGLVERVQYDGRRHVIQRRLQKPGGNTLWRLQTFADAAGWNRLESTTIRAGARSRHYALDSVYRLTDYHDDPVAWRTVAPILPGNVVVAPAASGKQVLVDARIGPHAHAAGSPAFVYDAPGNRLQSHELGINPSVSVPNALDQYTAVDGVPWTYDQNGNQRSDAVHYFSYDFDDRVQVIGERANGATRVTYLRDALGRIVAERNLTGTVFRVYDGAVPLVELNGNSRSEFVVGHRPASVLHAAHGSEEYWSTYDGIGSLRVLTNSSGNAMAIPDYRPFGTSESGELGLSPFSFGFAGMRHTSGVHYYHSDHRTYRPDVGRHLQRDPAGTVDDLNPYAYVSNNPVNFADPLGLGKVPFFGMMDLVREGVTGAHLVELSDIYRNLESLDLDLLEGELTLDPDIEFAAIEAALAHESGGPSMTELVLAGLDVVFPDPVEILERFDPSPDLAIMKNRVGGVYLLFNRLGRVVRTGRTNDLIRRQRQLAKMFRGQGLTFEPIFRSGSHAVRRGLEEMLYILHPEAVALKGGVGGLNKVRGISLLSGRRQVYERAAAKFLGQLPFD